MISHQRRRSAISWIMKRLMAGLAGAQIAFTRLNLAGQQVQSINLYGAEYASETVLGRENMAGALALGMIVVMVVVMWGYAVLQSRTSRWQR